MLGLLRQKRITSRKRSTRWRTRSLKFRKSGSPTRLSLLDNRTNLPLLTQIVKVSVLRRLFLNKRKLDLSTQSKAMRKRFVHSRSLLKILTLRWISLTISTIRIQLNRQRCQTITSTLKMSLNKSWRSSRMRASVLRAKSPLLKRKRLIFLLKSLRLRDKYCSGSVRSSSKEKCKKLLTPTLGRPKLCSWK